ncbi:sigma 54-interacting transcriptional regulator [Abyssisolibacter fermentans]|uniref:sigma 54-interacting transcriptional regulator n=1 Tax=Abyssisolibacter fermentans TaxID=1766203 RepID=UPI000829B2D8|nr:sigma 54-interacting transcriptional regulator [Abyssisolibacter fermentans]
MKIKNIILSNINLKDVMDKNVLIKDKQANVHDILNEMIDREIDNVIIIDNENAKAVLSIKDIIKAEICKLTVDKYIDLNNKYIRYALYEYNCTNDLMNILVNNNDVEYVVILNDNKKPIGLICNREINELYTKIIDKSYKLFENIIDNMHDAICAVDKDNKVIIWNKSAEKLYEIDEKDIEGKLITEMFPTALLPKVVMDRKEYRNVYNNPRENCYDIISATPLYDEGEFIGAVSCDMDISELIRISQLYNTARSNLSVLENEVAKLNESRFAFSQIVSANKKFENIIKLCKNIAKSKVNILISGESGTGKEVLSRAIHIESKLKGYFVPVNCSTISNDMLEELFGCDGTIKSKKIGKFELADKGTIFLEEISDLSLDIQDKILKIIDEGIIIKSGSNEKTKVDVKIIAAVSKDLKKQVQMGLFREELFHRLNAVSVHLPPLRERQEDIPILANKFINDFCITYRKNVIEIPKKIMQMMINYEWKGNIRELKNVIERIVILSKNNILDERFLPDIIVNSSDNDMINNKESLDLIKAIENTEKNTIKAAMKISGGNKMKAAKLLNIPRSTLYFKLSKYEIE